MRTEVMKEMGWSYPDWRATPLRIINETIDVLSAKSLARKHEGEG